MGQKAAFSLPSAEEALEMLERGFEGKDMPERGICNFCGARCDKKLCVHAGKGGKSDLFESRHTHTGIAARISTMTA